VDGDFEQPFKKRDVSQDDQSINGASDREDNQLDHNITKIGSVVSMQRVTSGGASDFKLHDDIRMTSGQPVPRQ
jgi:hypothetical protein